MSEYMIVPTDSIDATADAIKTKLGTQNDLTWGQDGFASYVENIQSGYTLEQIYQVGAPGVTGSVVYTGNNLPPCAFLNNTGMTSFTSNTLQYLMGAASGGAPYRAVANLNVSCTFFGCSNLESVSIPNLQTFAYCDKAFYGCSKLSTWDLPFKTIPSLGAQTFYNCTHLPSLVLTSFNDPFYADTFYECTSLIYIDCGAALTANRAINNNSFRNARNLSMLIFRSTSKMFTLNNVNAFGTTPFASDGAGGTLYVPQDMISTYQSATNWSTILGYANNSIKSIESTHTDPDAPIDLTLYYADGTLIPT